MLNRTRITASLILTVLFAITAGIGPAGAAEPGVDVGTCGWPMSINSDGDCVYLSAEDAGTSVSGGGGNRQGGPPVCRQADEDSRLPLCYHYPYGSWNQTKKCWTKRSDPQPESDFFMWEGRTYGAIYDCWRSNTTPTIGRGGGVNEMMNWQYWSSDGQVDLEELARRAVDEMHLTAPAIGLTGYGKPESLQLLGLPTWVWISDPGESTTGPVTRSASAGSVTVTATGRLTATVWQMGDGSTVTCAGSDAAGTPYDASYGGAPSPTCGYRYGWTSAREPGGAFTVTVTANWAVDWSGGGRSGVIYRSVVRSTQLRVGEVQVITDRRGDKG